ncbi:hypothetical protein BDZ91DRAFT_757960 [Kalaharituber pfeilii]|nr:hypothetical protein BDZ91DRAFT_757960 [Kalaharituber pfeilii]
MFARSRVYCAGKLLCIAAAPGGHGLRPAQRALVEQYGRARSPNGSQMPPQTGSTRRQLAEGKPGYASPQVQGYSQLLDVEAQTIYSDIESQDGCSWSGTSSFVLEAHLEQNKCALIADGTLLTRPECYTEISNLTSCNLSQRDEITVHAPNSAKSLQSSNDDVNALLPRIKHEHMSYSDLSTYKYVLPDKPWADSVVNQQSTSSQVLELTAQDNSPDGPTQEAPGTSQRKSERNQSYSSDCSEQEFSPINRQAKVFRKGPSTYAGKPADEINLEDDEIPYAQLIYKALMSVPSRTMILGEIYEYFRKNIPRFSKIRTKGWQNSIRHNLSMNGAFRKVERPPAPDGTKKRGYFWVLAPEAEHEGVKSTTRFRKNTMNNRKKAIEYNIRNSTAQTTSCSSSPSLKKRSRGKTRPKFVWQKTRETRQLPAEHATSSRNSTPESTVPTSDEHSEGFEDIVSSNRSSIDGPIDYVDGQRDQTLDLSTHPAFYPLMWECPSSVHNHGLGHNIEGQIYDEPFISAFNEEFSLIESSQAHQGMLNEELPCWPWPHGSYSL